MRRKNVYLVASRSSSQSLVGEELEIADFLDIVTGQAFPCTSLKVHGTITSLLTPEDLTFAD